MSIEWKNVGANVGTWGYVFIITALALITLSSLYLVKEANDINYDMCEYVCYEKGGLQVKWRMGECQCTLNDVDINFKEGFNDGKMERSQS